MLALRLLRGASAVSQPLTHASTHAAPFLRHASSLQTRQMTRPRLGFQSTFKPAQVRPYRRVPFQYQRFQRSSGFFRSWAARPTFYYEVGGMAVLGSGLYVYNLETVPVSGRRRFNIISGDTEIQMSQSMYQQIINEYRGRFLPPSSKEHRMAERVLQRLIPHSGIEDADWEVHVIKDDRQTNAFVIPGGKVFVFTGILRVCDGDDGLAAVLGHEIAHNVAHHAAERMSQSAIMVPIAIVGALFGVDFGLGRMLTQLAFELPGSRAQESEADYIGLLMMAESCYDPSAAMKLWARMEQEEKAQGVAVPQYISTHPSSHNRLEKIHSWLPEANNKRDESGCGMLGSQFQGFKQVASFPEWRFEP